MSNIRLIKILAVGFLLLGVDSRASAPASHPLADRVEAVVVTGKDSPPDILNNPIPSYRLFAYRGSMIEAIPMQIDEKDMEGNFLIAKGPQGGKGDGKFSMQDELAFIAGDSGQQYEGKIPTGCATVADITISDNQSGAQGHVILAQCKSPPPLVSKNYVRVDASTHTVITDYYQFGWKRGLKYYYDFISIHNGPNILDRVKVRCYFGKWGVGHTFTEEDFKSAFIGYTDGQVRVIWRMDNVWNLLGPFGELPSPQEMVFYPRYIVDKDPLDLTANPALFGLDFNLIIAHDMNTDMNKDYLVCSNMIPKCIRAEKSENENISRAINQGDMLWGGISGEEGAMITRLFHNPMMTIKVKGIFIYNDGYKDPPEYFSGALPLIGFKLTGWDQVKPRLYNLIIYHYFIDHYSLEEFNRFDRMVTSPLACKINHQSGTLPNK